HGFGIHIYDEKKPFYSGNIIRAGFANILIEGNRVVGSKGASGIVIAAHDGIPIRNVIVRSNAILRNDLNGIEVRNGSDIAILDNIFRDNGREGIRLAGSPKVRNVRIDGNIITSADETVCREHCIWYGRYHIAASGRVSGMIVRGNVYWPPSIGFRNAFD